MLARMDRYQRILTLHRTLKQARYPVTVPQLEDILECSRATVYRDVALLRDALGAPIVGGDEEQPGFLYDGSQQELYELPGLWLNSDELAALVALHALLGRSDPGVLSGAVEPIRERIEALLREQTGGASVPVERIRVVSWGARRLDQHVFQVVAGAVLQRRKLFFHYRARTRDEESRRTVSPQRLTHYRDNWYLDAWDEGRGALRSFSVDRVRHVRALDEHARDVSVAELDETLASSFGIFAGAPRHTAVIRFSAHAARWVADEHWHSSQEGRRLADGRYELRVPYSHSRELLMDILKYGPDAEVVAPVSLREEMRIMLQLAVGAYAAAPGTVP